MWLVEDVCSYCLDVVLIGGDIGEVKCFVWFFMVLLERVSVFGYFVLGNYDYYYGLIVNVWCVVWVLFDDYKGCLIWFFVVGVV